MDDRIILNTKLYKPSVRSNLILREALNRKLNESILKGHKVILVSAAAGYGKTTLISGWLNQLDCSCTWFSLDKYDNDPAKFINYLTTAVQKIYADFGKTIEDLMTAPKLLSVEIMSSHIIRGFEQLKKPLILVLDDYHTINCSYIHELMEKLLDSAVPNFVTIILSRQDPPFTLSRWRARDRITEIRAIDLKFEIGEIKEFFSRYFGIVFEEDVLRIIVERTEGWAAGLQLTGLSIKDMGKNQARQFVMQYKGNNRFITDYLIDEVLERQEDQIRSFIKSTCMLKRFRVELCDYMIGTGDSRGILEKLERENLFIIPLDSSRTWYRYHHLFSEFLQLQLDESQKTEACKKACLWFRENGFTEEALEYALEAEDGETAACLVKNEAMELFQKGELKTLLSRLNSVAEIKKKKEGMLEIYRAWCLLIIGEISEANKIIENLEEIKEGSDNSIITGMIWATAPFRYDGENKGESMKLAEQAVKLVEGNHNLFYYGALMSLGHANGINGHAGEAAALYTRAHEGARRKGYRFLELSSLFDLSFYLNFMGKKREALALCERALERCTDQNGNHLPMAKIVYLPKGLLMYCSNRLEEAQKYLEEGIACYQELGFAHLVGLGEWYLVLLFYVMGEKEKAFQMAYRLKVNFKDYVVHRITVFFEALEMELHLREGNVERVIQWMNEPGTFVDKISSLPDVNSYFTCLKAMIMHGDLNKAEIALKEKEGLVRKEGRYGELITVLILSALTKKHLRMEADALSYIREALTIAAPSCS